MRLSIFALPQDCGAPFGPTTATRAILKLRSLFWNSETLEYDNLIE
jgi:hypothetical protein